MSDPSQTTPEAPPPAAPPPDNVGGQAALDGEDGGDGRPVLRHEVLGDRTFHLRSGVPSALLGRLQSTARKVVPLADKRNEDMTDADKQAAMDSQVAFFDAVVKLIVAEERDAFVEYCEDRDPVIDGDGWALLLGAAIETVSGRPTTAP